MNFGNYNIYNKQHISPQQFNRIRAGIDQKVISLNEKLRSLGISGPFPDKFSHDLYDIQMTCKKQDQLLTMIKKNRQGQQFFYIQIANLNNKINKLQTQLQQQTRQFKQQIQSWKNNYLQEKKINQQLSQKNKRKKDQMQKLEKRANQLLIFNNQLVRRQAETAKKYCKVEEQLRKEHQRKNNFIGGNNSKEHANNNLSLVGANKNIKGMKVFNGGMEQKSQNHHHNQQQNIGHKKPQIINTKDKILKTQQIHQSVHKMHYDNLRKDFKNLEKQNDLLKEWLDRFIQTIKRVLFKRVEQLKDMEQQKREQYIRDVYLPECNVNNGIYTDQVFPYSKILSEFQILAEEAQKLRLQKQRYDKAFKKQNINIRHVQMIVQKLSDIRSSLIKQIQLISYRRQDLKNKYIKLFPNFKNVPFSQILQQCSFQQLQSYSKSSWQILQIMQQEINKSNKQIQQLIKNSNLKRITQMDNIQNTISRFQKHIQYFRNLQKNQEHLVRQDVEEFRQQYFVRVIERDNERKQRERKTEKLVNQNQPHDKNQYEKQQRKKILIHQKELTEQQKQKLQLQRCMHLRLKYLRQQWFPKIQQDTDLKKKKYKQMQKRVLQRKRARQQGRMLQIPRQNNQANTDNDLNNPHSNYHYNSNNNDIIPGKQYEI